MAKYDASFIVRLPKSDLVKFNDIIESDSVNQSALIRKWIEDYIFEKGIENEVSKKK